MRGEVIAMVMAMDKLVCRVCRVFGHSERPPWLNVYYSNGTMVGGEHFGSRPPDPGTAPETVIAFEYARRCRRERDPIFSLRMKRSEGGNWRNWDMVDDS